MLRYPILSLALTAGLERLRGRRTAAFGRPALRPTPDRRPGPGRRPSDPRQRRAADALAPTVEPMSAAARALRPLVLAALALCAGCVAFERSPVAERRCDRDLPGHWRLRAEGIDKTLRIDARCHTEDWPGLRERPVALDLTGFAIGEDRYIVLSPAEAERAIGAEGRSLTGAAPAGAVFLVLYRIEDGRISAWLPDSQRALAAIARGELDGRKLEDRFALVQGDAERLRATLARHTDLLYDTRAKAMSLQRVPSKEHP